jgi:hypothetical protein
MAEIKNEIRDKKKLHHKIEILKRNPDLKKESPFHGFTLISVLL